MTAFSASAVLVLTGEGNHYKVGTFGIILYVHLKSMYNSVGVHNLLLTTFFLRTRTVYAASVVAW